MIGFEYEKINSENENEITQRTLLGVEFPELEKKFDGSDKEYLKDLSELYLNLLDKVMEKSANRETCKEWLLSTDFFQAPSSTKYHSAFIGGLLYHSLLVTECLIKKCETQVWGQYFEENNISLEKLIFIAMTHDLCKINFYNIDYKNQKVYSETGSKYDERGKFDWKTVPVFTINEELPLGHSEKSIYLIEHHFFRLPEDMALAIRGHMGFSLEGEVNLFQNIVRKCPLALALSEADQEASMLFEYRENPNTEKIKRGNSYE